MLLYHGSSLIVKTPLLIEHNCFLDFGSGFYTTSSEVQAIQFARKVMVRNKSKECFINRYDFDINKANQKLKILKFDSPDNKWLDFVCANRRGKYTGQQYDLVIGPVANDDVFPTIRLYEAGFLSREQAIEAVKVRNLFDQFVFLTEKAISMLVFQGANNG